MSDKKSSLRRVILAAIVVPFAVALTMFVVVFFMAAFYGDGPGDSPKDWLAAATLFAGIGATIAFAASIVAGIPLYLVLERFNLHSIGVCAVLGGACGFVTSLMIGLPGPEITGLAMVCGVSAGVTFPLVARR